MDSIPNPIIDSKFFYTAITFFLIGYIVSVSLIIIVSLLKKKHSITFGKSFLVVLYGLVFSVLLGFFEQFIHTLLCIRAALLGVGLSILISQIAFDQIQPLIAKLIYNLLISASTDELRNEIRDKISKL
jgi:hypothetical protein